MAIKKLVTDIAMDDIKKSSAQAISALKDFNKEVLNSYDSARKLSESIGVATENIVGIRYAANLSRISTGDLAYTGFP
jgi:uncharacterized protein (DUF4213/DUF364 family)